MPKKVEGGSLGVGSWAIPNMARRVLTAVAVIMTACILLTMFAGCNQTPEERFEEWRSNSDVALTSGADVLQENAISLLKENDITVLDSYVSSDFMDGIPYITFVALVAGENGKELKSYSVETEYDGPIASAFGYNSDKISVYGNMLYIDYYFEYADYELEGDEIIVTE